VGSEVKMLDLGVQISWYHRSSNSGQYQTTYAGPGGTVVERTVLANAYDTDLMPLLAIARYRFAPPTDAVQPYVGGGIGYEWLWISTQGAVVYDPYGYPYYSEVGTSYGGFGGMALAGANFKITPTSAVYVEGEYNWSTVSADYYDPYYNVTVRESINMDGLGIQGGFRFRF
jgi:outer membrane protein W